MLTYEPRSDEYVTETAKRMVALAQQQHDSVTAKFNDITLTAKPGDNPDAIVEFYNTEMDRRHEERVKSPEYKQQQREDEERERRRALKLKDALAIAPGKITLRDEARWRKAIAANTDGYGQSILNYAERWARLMEGHMGKGDTLEACAEETSFLADNEGMSGVSFSLAASLLAQVWIHGERLHHWIQSKHESKKTS